MKYVIIGNGVAGTTAAENIRKLDQNGEITIFTDEATPYYSRIRLIQYLAKEADEKEIVIHKEEWYEKNNIRLFIHNAVTAVDQDNQHVITASGDLIQYDRLLIATGGTSFIPPVSGSDKKGVYALRTIRDADEMIRYADGRKKIILIGGGVLGLESGNSLRKTGHEITVVEFFPRLLPRQMDHTGAEVLKEQMEDMGFSFYLDARTKEITGDEKADGILLEDGTKLDGEMVIISAGVRPAADLARTIGLTVNKGVVVNDRMETEIKDIYAAGDLIEHREKFYGIWPAAREQGKTAGINMAGGDEVYKGTTMSNVLKVAGIDLAAAGEIDADGNFESIIHKDSKNFIYKKLVIKENNLAGCILLGDIAEYRKVVKAMESKRDISDIRHQLEQWDMSLL